MSESIYLLTLFSILATVLLVFAFRYLAMARQDRWEVANEADYRELASRSANALSDAAALLGTVHTEVGLLGVRLAAIEKVLKDVE